jgi:N-acetyltransferase 10
VQASNKQETLFVTASRGRGKSAALGLSIAGALLYQSSSIFVSAATPENLKTVFEFIQKGLEFQGLKINLDFEL